MTDSWFELLLQDTRRVYQMIPRAGALEPWLMATTGDDVRFLATGLELMTRAGVLRVGNDTDADGGLWRLLAD